MQIMAACRSAKFPEADDLHGLLEKVSVPAPASHEEVAGSSLGAALLQCSEHLHNDRVNVVQAASSQKPSVI